jgi:hypothetical protein
VRFGLPSRDLFLDLCLGREALGLGVGMGCGFAVGWARRRVVLGVVGSRRVWGVAGTRVEPGRRRHWCSWCEEQRSL